MIYIRAWNGADPESSTHYGDSGLYTISDALFDRHDYGVLSTDVSLGGCPEDIDGDFNKDGDVDGIDSLVFVKNPLLLDVGSFAKEFGKRFCSF